MTECTEFEMYKKMERERDALAKRVKKLEEAMNAARRLRAILDIRLSVAAQEAIMTYTNAFDDADERLGGSA